MNQDLKNIPFLIKNYKALIFFVSIALLCTSVYSQNSSISNTKKQASIVLTKYGKQSRSK